MWLGHSWSVFGLLAAQLWTPLRNSNVSLQILDDIGPEQQRPMSRVIAKTWFPAKDRDTFESSTNGALTAAILSLE